MENRIAAKVTARKAFAFGTRTGAAIPVNTTQIGNRSYQGSQARAREQLNFNHRLDFEDADGLLVVDATDGSAVRALETLRRGLNAVATPANRTLRILER